jgi:integrase
MPKLSVYKRGNVYWVDTYVEGRRVRRSTGCRSKTEAAHAAERIVRAADAGQLDAAGEQDAFTLRQAIELRRDYLEKLVAEGKRSLQTLRSYNAACAAIETGLEVEEPCEDLTESRIRQWADYESTRPLRHGKHRERQAPSTVAKLVRELRAILRRAHRQEMITARVHDRVPDDLVERPEPHVEALTIAEREKIIAAARPAWVARFLEIANETGCRAGELLMLERGRVSFDAEDRALAVVIKTKTGRPRTLMISSPTALRALEEQLDTPGKTYLFESPDTGRHFAVGTLHGQVRAAFERAGMYQLFRGVHTFRRSVLSDMMAANELLDVAADAMGHSAATAARHYKAAGVTDERAKAALLRYQSRKEKAAQR